MRAISFRPVANSGGLCTAQLVFSHDAVHGAVEGKLRVRVVDEIDIIERDCNRSIGKPGLFDRIGCIPACSFQKDIRQLRLYAN